MNNKFKNFYFSKKMSLTEQIHFAKRLSFLLDSGIPIKESLEIIENQTKNKKRILFYKDLVSKVSEGRSFSTCLKPAVSDFAWSLIDSGESGGFLSNNLNYLSEQLSYRKETIKKIKQAFLYPSFIAVMTLGITIFLIIYIFPKILPVIKSLNIDLPITTKFVMSSSFFIADFWIFILTVLSVLILGFIALLKNSIKFRFFVHKYLLKIPFFKNIYIDFLLANFCRNLSLLLKGGLTIDASLSTSSFSMSNLFFRQKILEIKKLVIEGQKFSEILFISPEIFPDSFTQIVEVGERTGNLIDVLYNSSLFYEKEFSDKIKNLSQVIEPFLLMSAGLIVGIVAVSIISPIYEITKNLHVK